jgi:hypothetical protein
LYFSFISEVRQEPPTTAEEMQQRIIALDIAVCDLLLN